MRTLAPIIVLASIITACGTVEPQSDEILVVEAFVMVDDSAPTVHVRHSQTVWGMMDGANPVGDAEVYLDHNGQAIRLAPGGEGRYRSPDSLGMSAGDVVAVDVRWRDMHARGSSVIPPSIRIDSFRVSPSLESVESVVIDSLQLGAPPPETGWVYLVDVSIWWQAPRQSNDSFVRARLSPESPFAGVVVDFFLRSDHIFEERSARSSGGVYRWDGVYAVRVGGPDDPLPTHELQLALLRSGRDYARYASSRDAADRREPVGNVKGGIGIVAGVAVDSMRTIVAR
jgi:hypothetical protein